MSTSLLFLLILIVVVFAVVVVVIVVIVVLIAPCHIAPGQPRHGSKGWPWFLRLVPPCDCQRVGFFAEGGGWGLGVLVV